MGRREMPQVDIPDEITQVDFPEFDETTPHPDVTSPQAGSASGSTPDVKNAANPIGFRTE